jgi:hypothetical protein
MQPASRGTSEIDRNYNAAHSLYIYAADFVDYCRRRRCRFAPHSKLVDNSDSIVVFSNGFADWHAVSSVGATPS